MKKKLEVFGCRDAAYVWRKKGEMSNPNTVPTVKHGGRSPVGGRNHKEKKHEVFKENVNQSTIKKN